MLKKSLEEFNHNVFSDLKDICPILTAGDRENGYNAMTVSWGGFGVLWGKNVAFVFVRKSRYTYEFIEKSNSVTLSFLNEKYKEKKSIFGSTSGRTTDKFQVSGFHATYDIDYNGYYVTESDYVLKMKKMYAIDLPYDDLPLAVKEKCYPNGDMHRMYVCEIMQYLVNEE